MKEERVSGRANSKGGMVPGLNVDESVFFHTNRYTYPIHFGSNDLDAMIDSNDGVSLQNCA